MRMAAFCANFAEAVFRLFQHNRPIADSRRLLQAGLAKTLEEFRHRPVRVGDVALDPGD